MTSTRVVFAGSVAVAASAVRALSTLEQQAADHWLMSANASSGGGGICDNSSSLLVNGSSLFCNDTSGNFSSGNDTHGAPTHPDSLTDVIFMAVTSVILGLMILITVIGESALPFTYVHKVGTLSHIGGTDPFHFCLFTAQFPRLRL
jgi:hypothetical protein